MEIDKKVVPISPPKEKSRAELELENLDLQLINLQLQSQLLQNQYNLLSAKKRQMQAALGLPQSTEDGEGSTPEGGGE